MRLKAILCYLFVGIGLISTISCRHHIRRTLSLCLLAPAAYSFLAFLPLAYWKVHCRQNAFRTRYIDIHFTCRVQPASLMYIWRSVSSWYCGDDVSHTPEMSCWTSDSYHETENMNRRSFGASRTRFTGILSEKIRNRRTSEHFSGRASPCLRTKRVPLVAQRKVVPFFLACFFNFWNVGSVRELKAEYTRRKERRQPELEQQITHVPHAFPP